MEALNPDEGLPPGFRFHPTDEELVTYYLTTKVLDNSFSGRAIAEVDLNKCEPWDLPDKAKMGEKEWYFFSLRDRKYPTGLRTNRATEAGYWKATGKDREVFNARTGNLIGMKKTLVFYKGRAPRGEKTNWVMHEYRLEGNFSYQQLPRASKEEWVVCRIFHKSAGAKKPTSGLMNSSNMYVDDCLGSPSLPPLLESPCYTNTAIHSDEAQLSDSHFLSNNFFPNDPQLMKPPNPNPMAYILSQISSNAMGFQGFGSQAGLPSSSILRALVEQYSGSDMNLKHCKMEPSSSLGGQDRLGANQNNMRIPHEAQWTIDDHQQKINSGIPQNPHDHNAPCSNSDHMNSEMFSRVSRSYQVEPSAAASPPVDLDSLWAY